MENLGRLFLVDDKVEVRSLDDGIIGSWHVAKVIGCGNLLRSVRYDFLLNDDASDNLVEHVPVSYAIEGCFDRKTSDTYRNLIRPSPSFTHLGSRYIHYGQCVDMFYEDAWWEGVVFDHENDSHTRRIFFPNQGDELEGQIDMLRISEDWDEFTRKWTPRKNWMFLEIIEEFEIKYPLPISIKQIWYEVKEKNENLKEWASVEQKNWKDLVFPVICDNFKMSIMHICNELNFYPQIEFSNLKLNDLLGMLMTNPSHDPPVEISPSINVPKLRASGELISSPSSNVTKLRTSRELISSPSSNVTKFQPPRDLIFVEPEFCPESVNDYLQLPTTSGRRDQDKVMKAKKHLSASEWTFFYVQRGPNKREIRYKAPTDKVFNSLYSACNWWVQSYPSYPEPITEGSTENIHYIEDGDDLSTANVSNLPLAIVKYQEKFPISDIQKERSIMGVQVHNPGILGKRKNKSPKRLKGDPYCDSSALMVQSCKKSIKVTGSSNQNSRTILQRLIDSGVVLLGEVVVYRKKDKSTLMEGKITREGIKCSCCAKIFTLCNFETHAGSTYHRPSTYIFLNDGRSLADCQLQIKPQKGNSRSSRPYNKTEYRNIDGNDYMCSICHVGGELIMCDRCPSSFHKECVGLKDILGGEWFCPPCHCEICGIGKNLNQTNVSVCRQCEHLFHYECLQNKGTEDMKSEENWFCSDSCTKIFNGLQKSVGKAVQIGDMNWTLMKPINNNSANDIYSNCNSKLHAALGLMHECFKPLKEPGSTNDMIEDVIFCRRSNLNRLDFQGFYTVLLEKNDELVSAAIVRFLGEKVAEVPLVATRFQYRGLGMCRILMDQLEKKLKVLGVERLVLPAIPTTVNTWTNSFGFSLMSESERLKFLNYTFLGFEGTNVCHKHLTAFPS